MAGDMDWVADNWGSVVSSVGLVATVLGLWIVFRRASEARSSAEASRIAAQEARQAISGTLTIVDLERAIAMVERLKQLHRNKKWEVSLELYQPLRVMLTNIHARGTIETQEIRDSIPKLRAIEESITRALAQGVEPPGERSLPRVLNDIQVGLEQIASYTQSPSSEGR